MNDRKQLMMDAIRGKRFDDDYARILIKRGIGRGTGTQSLGFKVIDEVLEELDANELIEIYFGGK